MNNIANRSMTDETFLKWLSNRLAHRHNENNDILVALNSIIDNTVAMPKNLEPELIEKCCKKHFFDFEMDKSYDFKLGYTEEERNNIRKLVIDIYSTIKENR